MKPDLLIQTDPEEPGSGAAAAVVKDVYQPLTDAMMEALVTYFFRLRKAAMSNPNACGETFEIKLAASYSAQLDAWVVKFNGGGSVELRSTVTGNLREPPTTPPA